MRAIVGPTTPVYATVYIVPNTAKWVKSPTPVIKPIGDSYRIPRTLGSPATCDHTTPVIGTQLCNIRTRTSSAKSLPRVCVIQLKE